MKIKQILLNFVYIFRISVYMLSQSTTKLRLIIAKLFDKTDVETDKQI